MNKFWSEEHAKEYRQQVNDRHGTYLTLPQAIFITPQIQGSLFAWEKRR